MPIANWRTLYAHFKQAVCDIEDMRFTGALVNAEGTHFTGQKERSFPEFRTGSEGMTAHFTVLLLERAGFEEFLGHCGLIGHCEELQAVRKDNGSLSIYITLRSTLPTSAPVE